MELVTAPVIVALLIPFLIAAGPGLRGKGEPARLLKKPGGLFGAMRP